MLVNTTLTLQDVVNLKSGDIIPVSIEDEVSVFAEGIPVFKASHGLHNGHHAIKIADKMERPTHLETGIPFLDETFSQSKSETDTEHTTADAKALPKHS